MRFSQRIGKTEIKTILQVESIDERLSNMLWNDILEYFIEPIYISHRDNGLLKVLTYIWKDFYGLRSDEIPNCRFAADTKSGILKDISFNYHNSSWYQKYDLIEYLFEFEKSYKLNFSQMIGITLAQELAGYRVLELKFVPITSNTEVEAIEDAISNSLSYKSVENHLIASLDFLSNRESPDYRNSIKESISAVEAYCRILTDSPKETLGKALAKIQQKHKIHKALEEGFSKIYGFTSDEGGIRHALTEDGVELKAEDAKFMLIACSAFINYLKAKE